MTYQLIGHSFSSYTWKAMIALHEKELPYELLVVEEVDVTAQLNAIWPIGKFPVLLNDGTPIIEATTIIEYLDLHHYERAPLIPANANDALDVRFMDRIFDNHVMTPVQAAVSEALARKAGVSDPARTELAREKLETIYGWLEERLGGHSWACSQGFSLADCAAAPSLFYADWVHRIAPTYPNLLAYRARLNERASVARCIEGARPFRHYFPLGAPDRD